MIKRPAAVRDLLTWEVGGMLTHTHARLSLFEVTELDVMPHLQNQQRHELTIEIVSMLMVKFGHVTAPKEARFDKARRAANKAKLKGPRGEPRRKNDFPAVVEASNVSST